MDESITYFEGALATLKKGIEDDKKDLFVNNVLEQTVGHEVELSCHSTCSHCIDFLLEDCKDISVIIRFMKAFSGQLKEVCTNPYGSYIIENLLYYGLRQMQNWSSDVQPSNETIESEQKTNSITYIITWIHNLGQFCLDNFLTCLEDKYACHALRTLIQVLGGHYVGQFINQSKKSKKQKRHFQQEYLSSHNTPKPKEAFIIEHIPKFFASILRQITKVFMKLDDIKGYATDGTTAPVIESLLFVLKKHLPKRCKKFVKCLSSNLFEAKSNDGFPLALVHENCSYVVEKLFEAADEEQRLNLWTDHISQSLEQLILHPVGNCVLQRLFDIVSNQDQFEVMCHTTAQLFDKVLESQHFGIWLSIANACNRLKTQQAQFVKNLMQCLQCSDSEDKQVHFIALVLGLQRYEAYIKDKQSAPASCKINITLQGSLLLQAILKFHKPTKAVKSILSTKPEELAFMANHNHGCYVLRCFLESANVGEKNKDKLMHHLKTVLTMIACDRDGNLTLSRMWVLLSLKQKSIVLEELAKNEHILQRNRNGMPLIKKFGIFLFKHKFDQWKAYQQDFAKKRKICTE